MNDNIPQLTELTDPLLSNAEYNRIKEQRAEGTVSMAAGKRHSISDPLTEHDIAERLDKAALRVLRILMDARELEIMEQVKTSRYLTNSVNALAAELVTWGVTPRGL